MNENEKIIETIKNSGITPYKISQCTGISQTAIGNYINGKSKPNKIYTKCLEYFFKYENSNSDKKTSKNEKVIQTGDVNNSQITQDNREHYNECVSVLQEQLREKDLQISKLLDIISKK